MFAVTEALGRGWQPVCSSSLLQGETSYVFFPLPDYLISYDTERGLAQKHPTKKNTWFEGQATSKCRKNLSGQRLSRRHSLQSAAAFPWHVTENSKTKIRALGTTAVPKYGPYRPNLLGEVSWREAAHCNRPCLCGARVLWDVECLCLPQSMLLVATRHGRLQDKHQCRCHRRHLHHECTDKRCY